MTEPWDELQFYCETCGAQPGEVCLRSSGARASQPHTPRMRKGNEVYFQYHPKRPWEPLAALEYS